MLSGKFQNRDIPGLKVRLLAHMRSRAGILVQESLNFYINSYIILGGTKLMFLDFMKGMTARYPATREGQEMTNGYLASPERQVSVTKKFAAPEEVR